MAVNLDAVSVDVEAFLAEVERLRLRRRVAPSAATAATSSRRTCYEDWATRPARAGRRRLRGRAARAEPRRSRGDADEAVRAHLRLLEHDRWDAGAHLALIARWRPAGRHGEAIRRRRAYRPAMAEIGVAVAPHLKTLERL